jgi:hypothetical protein
MKSYQRYQRVNRLISKFLSNFVRISLYILAFNLTSAHAQNSEDVYIGIYKSSNQNEAKDVSSRTTGPSKIIKWIETNEWIVGLGPYSPSSAIATAEEIARNYKSKTGQDFQYAFIKFKANTPDEQLNSKNIINSSSNSQASNSTSNKTKNDEWIKEKEFNGSKPGIIVHLLYGRMKRDGDLVEVSSLYNYYPNARGDNSATDSTPQLARSRVITELVNCRSNKVAITKDNAYSKHWGEDNEVIGAFQSKIDREPAPFAKVDIELYRKICGNANQFLDKTLSQQWKILESNAERREAESKKWNQYICDGKYSQVTKNITIKNNATAQAGFAYTKTNDKLSIELAGVYERMYAAKSENIANFSTSSMTKNSSSVSGFYQQNNSPVGFKTMFDTQSLKLQISYSIGGVQTIFEGKCHQEAFL